MIALDRDRLSDSMGPSILVLGARGILGRAFVRALSGLSLECAAWGRDRLDISDGAAVRRHIAPGPWSTVINAAAWTNVDGAEADETGAMRTNGEGVAHLRDACDESGACLVNFGTDYVFGGMASHPYGVGDPLAPINAYGRSKAAGERALAGMRQALQVRTSWLYAPWGNNFVRTIARKLRTEPSLRVVADQRGRPTSAEHLARATLALLASRARGIFHATDGGDCTWLDLARQIAANIGSATPIEPCSSDDFPRPARRPAYSVLDLSRTEALVGPMPDWRDNLADVITRLEP